MDRRVITPEQILHLAADEPQPLRLRTVRDTLPGGLSAAMAPLLVDWNASELDGEAPFVLVHNLNYGGNPLEGTTVLQTARVPLGSLAAVDWTLGAGLAAGPWLHVACAVATLLVLADPTEKTRLFVRLRR